MQVADLSVGPLRVNWVLEGVEYFFESKSGVGFAIGNLPNVTVGTWADLFCERVSGKNVIFNLFCHFYIIGFKFIIFSPLNS